MQPVLHIAITISPQIGQSEKSVVAITAEPSQVQAPVDIENCNFHILNDNDGDCTSEHCECDTASEPIHDANANPPLKRHRKTYTDNEKRAVINAELQGGRRSRIATAEAINMPRKTADSLIKRYRANRSDHDRRRDHELHKGQNSKCQKRYIKMIIKFLHENSNHSHEHIRQHLNIEILRQIVLSHEIPTSMEEKQTHGPLDIQKYLKDQGVNEEYESRLVKSSCTMAHWINGLIYSRKNNVPEKAAMNTASMMAERLEYATWMNEAISCDENLVVFLDEIPFYLTMKHFAGLSKRGEHAAVPVREFVFRTRVAMAVTKQHGLICSSVFPPEIKVHIQNNSTTSQQACDSKLFTTKDRFINQILFTLLEKKQELKLSTMKCIYIVADDAPDHEHPNNFDVSLASLPNYKELYAYLQENNVKLKAITMPSHSSELNLCEYYTRTLRSRANVIRAERDIDEMILEQIEHEKKLEASMNILESVCKTCIEEIQKHGSKPSNVLKMMKFYRWVIDDKGYLDMHRKM